MKHSRTVILPAVVVLDGKAGNMSQRFAYAARVGKKWLFVVDGKEERSYDGVGAGGLTFAPDSQRFTYARRIGKRWSVVLDGAEGPEYDAVIVNGYGGGRVVFGTATSFHYMAVRGKASYLVEETLQ
jgi:hypothetical protein